MEVSGAPYRTMRRCEVHISPVKNIIFFAPISQKFFSDSKFRFFVSNIFSSLSKVVSRTGNATQKERSYRLTAGYFLIVHCLLWLLHSVRANDPNPVAPILFPVFALAAELDSDAQQRKQQIASSLLETPLIGQNKEQGRGTEEPQRAKEESLGSLLRFSFLGASSSSSSYATPRECYSSLQSVVNPTTRRVGVEVYLVGCLSTASMKINTYDVPYQLPYDSDYKAYWDATGQFFTQSPGSKSFNESNPENPKKPLGDPALLNYYNRSIIRGYTFAQEVTWAQPHYYPQIPTTITNSPNTAENSLIQRERDECAAYCNQKHIEDSKYTPVAASTDIIRFALAYGRCTCLGPLTGSSIQIGDARNPECCRPMPNTVDLSLSVGRGPQPSISGASGGINGPFPNVEAVFAPQPSTCHRYERYAVVYQLHLTCPINGTYCDYKQASCIERVVAAGSGSGGGDGAKRCCYPIGSVPVTDSSGSSDTLADTTAIVQWLIAGIIIVAFCQFTYWVLYQKIKRMRTGRGDDERGADDEDLRSGDFLDANGNVVRGLTTGGANALAQRLLLPAEGEVGGLVEELSQEDVIGRMPMWADLEREMVLRNRVASRQGLEIILIPGTNNGIPLSVIIKSRSAAEKIVAATEAMRLLPPVSPEEMDDPELCCPICTDNLTEEVYGVQTQANHGKEAASGKAKQDDEIRAEEKLNDDAGSHVRNTSSTSETVVVALRDALDDGRGIDLEQNLLTGGRHRDDEGIEMQPLTATTGEANNNNNHGANNGAYMPPPLIQLNDTLGGARNNDHNSSFFSEPKKVEGNLPPLLPFSETSNVVSLACKHLIHRECMFEYASHTLKSYLAPITCPLCRGIVVLQNLAVEQEILKKSLIEFRFLVESELFRLVQLGATATIPPWPESTADGRQPQRPPPVITLADGQLAPIRTNAQLARLLRRQWRGDRSEGSGESDAGGQDQGLSFAGALGIDVPAPDTREESPSPVRATADDDGNGEHANLSFPPHPSVRSGMYDDTDPFRVLAPLELRSGGYQRSTVPLGLGMQSRHTRREILTLRMALVTKLRAQLQGSRMLTHTRVPSSFLQWNESNASYETHENEGADGDDVNGGSTYTEGEDVYYTNTNESMASSSSRNNRAEAGRARDSFSNPLTTAPPMPQLGQAPQSLPSLSREGATGSFPAGQLNSFGETTRGSSISNTSDTYHTAAVQTASFAQQAAPASLQRSFANSTPVALQVWQNNGRGQLTTVPNTALSSAFSSPNATPSPSGVFELNNNSFPALRMEPSHTSIVSGERPQNMRSPAPLSRGGVPPLAITNRGGGGGGGQATTSLHTSTANNGATPTPAATIASNGGHQRRILPELSNAALSRGLTRPARIVRRRGLSVRNNNQQNNAEQQPRRAQDQGEGVLSGNNPNPQVSTAAPRRRRGASIRQRGREQRGEARENSIDLSLREQPSESLIGPERHGGSSSGVSGGLEAVASVIASIPARAANVLAAGVGLVTSRDDETTRRRDNNNNNNNNVAETDNNNNNNGGRRGAAALLTAYEPFIEGMEEFSEALQSPRREDYADADAMAAGIFEEIRAASPHPIVSNAPQRGGGGGRGLVGARRGGSISSISGDELATNNDQRSSSSTMARARRPAGGEGHDAAHAISDLDLDEFDADL